MCGNSICQDRRFLHRLMPSLERHFHYRNLDVSTIKELARRWAPEVLAGVRKEASHTALSDVRDSIAELKNYRTAMGVFVAPHQPARAHALDLAGAAHAADFFLCLRGYGKA